MLKTLGVVLSLILIALGIRTILAMNGCTSAAPADAALILAAPPIGAPGSAADGRTSPRL
jgi:hypothetical protein